MIDEEVRKLIDEAYEKTKDLLTMRKGEVEKLATALLDREVLFQSDVEALIGKRPYEEKKSLVDDEPADQPVLGDSAISNPFPLDGHSTTGA
jgi:AFG3 family protein